METPASEFLSKDTVGSIANGSKMETENRRIDHAPRQWVH